jgi:hypothetical protein
MSPSVDFPPPFYPFLYSLDALLPIVDLHQEGSWQPTAESYLGLESLIYLQLHIVIGWVLSTLFLAGVVGIVRRIE